MSNQISALWLLPGCNISTGGPNVTVFYIIAVFFRSPPHHSNQAPPTSQQVRMSASCATRELDELMASLSDFKVARRHLQEASWDFLLAAPSVSPVHFLLPVCVARLSGPVSARASKLRLDLSPSCSSLLLFLPLSWPCLSGPAHYLQPLPSHRSGAAH